MFCASKCAVIAEAKKGAAMKRKLLLARAFPMLVAFGNWSPPTPSTLSLSSFKLTSGCVDFRLHFVQPFLQPPLINLAIVYCPVLEVFLEVLLVLASKVRHSAVEVPRVLLFLSWRRCTSFARACQRSRLRRSSPSLSASGFHPCQSSSRSGPKLREPCCLSPRFVWLTWIELHGTLL